MGFRFRKRIRLFKGALLNLSKSGTSLSVGGRGLTANVSKRGVRETVGLPGTGISYQTKRIWSSQHHGLANGRRQSVSPITVSAFVLLLAAILWILAHLH
jgi:hypothetical protein